MSLTTNLYENNLDIAKQFSDRQVYLPSLYSLSYQCLSVCVSPLTIHDRLHFIGIILM